MVPIKGKSTRSNGRPLNSITIKSNRNQAQESRWYRDLLNLVEAPETKGTRYDEAKSLIPKMIWWGHTGDEVFRMMRDKYSPDYSDSQLWSTIHWAEKSITPRDGSSDWTPTRSVKPIRSRKPAEPEIDLEAILETVSVSECQCCPSDFIEKSPIAIMKAKSHQALIIKHLFKEGEFIAMTGSYWEPDTVKTREDWLLYLNSNHAPQSNKGGWIYMNPINESRGKHITNQDIAQFRYILLDGDELPKDDQLRLLGSIVPSISAIVDTGNRGYHAWVKLDAKNGEEYNRRARDTFRTLKALKFDPATKLPFCKSRMPNIHRVEADKKIDGMQQLIYLNSNPFSDVIFPIERRINHV